MTRGRTRAVRLLVADDHPLFRRAVTDLLSEHPDFVVADEAGDGSEVLQKVERGQFDMVILDISLPDQNGLDVLDRLHSRHPTLPVLMLSFHPETRFAARALKLGAAGYLTKSCTGEELVKSVERILSGHVYVSPGFAEQLAGSMCGNSGVKGVDLLSNREHQIMQLIASGRSLTEISKKLSLSVKTVSTYRTRVLQKLDMKSNADIIRHAVLEGMVP